MGGFEGKPDGVEASYNNLQTNAVNGIYNGMSLIVNLYQKNHPKLVLFGSTGQSTVSESLGI